jgi:hypothetical protein
MRMGISRLAAATPGLQIGKKRKQGTLSLSLFSFFFFHSLVLFYSFELYFTLFFYFY